MRFSEMTLSALFMGSALALPATTPAESNIAPPSQSVSLTGTKAGGHLVEGHTADTASGQGLQKRGAVVVVAGIVGTAALTKLTEMAIEVGADFIKNLGEWDEAREAFTQQTTDEMWARNPNYAKFPAAVCYNKGYRLANPANVDGLVSVDFSLGLLHTDYDCMYIAGPNQFWTDSDGGYINLSYTYDSNRCSFDKATGDLSCN